MSVHFSTMKDRDRWRKHSDQWSGCILCPIGLACCNHVLGRGSLPCDVLLLGEAPGPSEDAKGEPFVGRAGSILDKILLQVRRKVGPFRYFISNTIACFPEDLVTGSFRVPSSSELQKCLPRVMQVVRMANPRGIIFLGKVAQGLEKVITKTDTVPWPDARLSVYHPSYIGRKGGARSLEGKKAVAAISKFIKSLNESAPF